MKEICSRPRLLILLSLLLTWPTAASPATPDGVEESPGQAAFLKLKCHICHAVSSAGIERKSKSKKLYGADLAGVGDRRDAEWMVAFLERQVENEAGEKHSKPYKGTDEELQAMVDWMVQLKAEDDAGPEG